MDRREVAWLRGVQRRGLWSERGRRTPVRRTPRTPGAHKKEERERELERNSRKREQVADAFDKSWEDAHSWNPLTDGLKAPAHLLIAMPTFPTRFHFWQCW